MTQNERTRSRRAVQQASVEAGGAYELAEAVGVTRQAVYMWIRGDAVISLENALRVSKATSIALADLRPDVDL